MYNSYSKLTFMRLNLNKEACTTRCFNGHLPGDPVSAVSSSSAGFGREHLWINYTVLTGFLPGAQAIVTKHSTRSRSRIHTTTPLDLLCHIHHESLCQSSSFYLSNQSSIKNKSSAVAEMGERGHNRHGLKRGGYSAPFAERWEPV